MHGGFLGISLEVKHWNSRPMNTRRKIRESYEEKSTKENYEGIREVALDRGGWRACQSI